MSCARLFYGISLCEYIDLNNQSRIGGASNALYFGTYMIVTLGKERKNREGEKKGEGRQGVYRGWAAVFG